MRRAGPKVAFAPLLLAMAAGCPKAEVKADPFEEALAAADALWARRAELGGLDAAEGAYAALLGQRPRSTEVLGRLSQVAWSRARVDPTFARTWHEAGREYAFRCMAGAEEFLAVGQAVGDRLFPGRLETLGLAHTSCAVWAAAHIEALVALRGPGSVLDSEDSDALLDWLGTAAPGTEPAVQSWARGRVALGQGDPIAARSALQRATELAPGQCYFRAALIAAYPDQAAQLEPFDPAPTWALENASCSQP